MAEDTTTNRPAVVGEPRLLVDGELRGARSGRTFVNVDPATEEVLGETADAGAEDLDDAIAAARRVADEGKWAEDPSLRARCLRQLHEAMERHREELRAVVVAEAGSPIALTYAIQLEEPIAHVAHWAEIAERYEYVRELPEREVFGARHRRVVVREPVGVVGAITPWNYPFYLNIAKVAPALAAGNAVVLKPAPDTPWSATWIGRLAAEESDLPPGVLNVVASSDHAVGEALVADPRVDLVSFTGSTATGRRIMATAAPTVKRLFLELGGKSANIVLEDANLEQAVAFSAVGVCSHAGQGCAIATRLIVARSRYDEAIELARSQMAAVAYGDPWDPANLQGPLISERQRERVLGYIEKGREEGARLVLGGGVPAHLPRGYYVEPTLFADVDWRSTIAQEEIFGPVLVVIPFDTDEEAVAIANGTIYGLSGAVFGADEARATAVARKLRAGTVAVNGGMWFAPDVPFGGRGQSGFGRENGVEGFEEYLDPKALAYPCQ
jgi:aldehyde dehydrogenase (NAD+)